MAHFAELDENNKVLRVLVVNNEVLLNEDGTESEQKGIDFLKSILGGNWVQTSYNHSFRKRYAGYNFTYDPVKNVFIPPKPYASWSLNEETCDWVPPIPQPDTGSYEWDEENQQWKEIV
jgi:hypothetical protein